MLGALKTMHAAAVHSSGRCLQRGLTLVELIVTLVIVGVLLTLAVPSFSEAVARERLRGANAQLVTDLKFARSEAIQRGEAVRVDFRSNPSASCYAIYAINAGGTCDCLQGTEQCVAGENGVQVELLKIVALPQGQGVSLTTQPSAIIINQERAFHTAELVVTLTGQRGTQLMTSLSTRGSIVTCSPNATMPGVPACPL